MTIQYEGQAYVENFVAQLINGLISVSDQLSKQPSANIDAVLGTVQSELNTAYKSTTFTKPTITPNLEPAVWIPDWAELPQNIFLKTVDNYVMFMTKAVTYMQAFANQHLIDDTPAIQWAQSAASGVSDSGITTARSKLVNTVSVLDADQSRWNGCFAATKQLNNRPAVLATLASKRTSDAANVLDSASAQLMYETAKAAISVLTQKRIAVVSTAAQYAAALIRGYDGGVRFTTIQVDGQQKLISAVSQYYGAKLAGEELMHRDAVDNVAFADAAVARSNAERVAAERAALQAAEQLAREIAATAASAINAVSAGGSMQSGAQYSESKDYTEQVSV